MDELKPNSRETRADRFRLDRPNAKIWGVCSGIACHFDLDVTVVRVAFVIATLIGFGWLIPVYLAIGLIAD